MKSGVQHNTGPGAAATPPLWRRFAVSAKQWRWLWGAGSTTAVGNPGAVPQSSTTSQQTRGGAGPQRRAAPNPAEAAGLSPVPQQSPLDAEGSNGVRSEAPASGRGPGQLGGRHLTREE
ncbi:hypothetical protein NDU88_004901 [Pleurodeles waltl]|uniref:Uncharacterized protein n=1 Tax=Pleurodeles waltl TaxID=8319 RepID=A0AAV7NNZ7_PLEWA|nr:hypothetical protein NDU88_004901 [Pleurodeles waltl]